MLLEYSSTLLLLASLCLFEMRAVGSKAVQMRPCLRAMSMRLMTDATQSSHAYCTLELAAIKLLVALRYCQRTLLMAYEYE